MDHRNADGSKEGTKVRQAREEMATPNFPNGRQTFIRNKDGIYAMWRNVVVESRYMSSGSSERRSVAVHRQQRLP